MIYRKGMHDLDMVSETVFMTSDFGSEKFGRGGFTGKPEDFYKFKVPQLYNLKDSPFYGHGSSFRSIRDIVDYKNMAVPENTHVPPQQLADDFIPLNLDEEEVNALVAFVASALYDPDLRRFEPEVLPSGNCFPFNDPLAQQHLGCE